MREMDPGKVKRKLSDETRKRIVELIGDLSKIELFARQKTTGWDVWGNEVESSLDMENLQENRGKEQPEKCADCSG